MSSFVCAHEVHLPTNRVAAACRFTGSQLCSTCEELADALGEQGTRFPSSCLTACPVLAAAVSDLGCMFDSAASATACSSALLKQRRTAYPVPGRSYSFTSYVAHPAPCTAGAELVDDCLGCCVEGAAAAIGQRYPYATLEVCRHRLRCTGPALHQVQAHGCELREQQPMVGSTAAVLLLCGLPCPYHLHCPVLHCPVLYMVWTYNLPAWCRHCQKSSTAGCIPSPLSLAGSALMRTGMRARVQGARPPA